MEKKLRIIHVVNVRWFNATAWYGLFLARLMKDAGHDVLVLGLAGTESFYKAESMGLTPLALPLTTQNPFTLWVLHQKLSRLLKKFRPHVVNCHRGEVFPLWAALKKKYGFRLIRTRGDQRPPKSGFFNSFLYATMADMVIATNSATAEALKKELSVPGEQIRTIYGGVDRELFSYSSHGRELFRKKFTIAHDDIVFGILGRFDHVKGQKELICAFALARKKLPAMIASRTKLLLAGFSTEISVEEIYQCLHDNDIADAAIITGKCDDVTACISAMDVGVIASLGSEAIARAAFEIMSCGVPLISTTVGVMPDLLPKWAMVEPGDCKALAALIIKAAEDLSWRDRLRMACLERITLLSSQEFLRQTLEAYEAKSSII